MHTCLHSAAAPSASPTRARRTRTVSDQAGAERSGADDAAAASDADADEDTDEEDADGSTPLLRQMQSAIERLSDAERVNVLMQKHTLSALPLQHEVMAFIWESLIKVGSLAHVRALFSVSRLTTLDSTMESDRSCILCRRNHNWCGRGGVVA
jgi:hypothetical protein